MASTDPIWLKNPAILWHKDKFADIFPQLNMSPSEQLNAVMRLFIALALVFLLVLQKGSLAIAFLVLGSLLTAVLFQATPVSKYKRVRSQVTPEERARREAAALPDFVSPGATSTALVGASNLDEAYCRPPTLDNPFMNTNVNDFGVPQSVGSACDPLAPENLQFGQEAVAAGAYALFDPTSYRDNMLLQRSFYTTPNTGVPNDQGLFAEWVWGQPGVCKEDQRYCNIHTGFGT